MRINLFTLIPDTLSATLFYTERRHLPESMSRRTSTRRRITILQQQRILTGARLTALDGGDGNSGGALGAHPLPPVCGGAHRPRGQAAHPPRGGVRARRRDALGLAHGATFRRAGGGAHRCMAHSDTAAFGARRHRGQAATTAPSWGVAALGPRRPRQPRVGGGGAERNALRRGAATDHRPGLRRGGGGA
jgi:hypothetical protein